MPRFKRSLSQSLYRQRRREHLPSGAANFGEHRVRVRLESMNVSFEISDRNYEELGPWPLAVGAAARAQLYAFRDHSPIQHGGRLLLPEVALAPRGTTMSLRRFSPLT